MNIQKHSNHVAQLCKKIGDGLKLFDEELTKLILAAYFHDIGKIFISKELLNKSAPLTSEEIILIRNHPRAGVEILQRLGLDDPMIISGVLHHHEKYNGTGYPSGLSGKDIPLFSKIIALADAYDAMTSIRPYRVKVLTSKQAFEEIRIHSGKQFDPDIVEIFIEVMIQSAGRKISNSQRRVHFRLTTK